ncbi:MAG: cytochrome c biogenesis protein CcdA, partial [Deltaproteobacteria bacterium]
MSSLTLSADVLGSLSNFWHLLRNVDSDQIKLIAGERAWLAVLLCFGSGILTSLTPCVYPMIPITINIFGRASQKHQTHKKPSSFNWHTFFLSSIYVAGMATTYSAMGLVAGMTGSLFGKILQSSVMLGFLTLLFLTLAVGQWGFFKIALPASWQTKLSQIGDSESLPGIFLMGLFSGLIVSPCVGPVIAGILAFVFETSNAFRGFIFFLSFSLGLGVLFLLIGGFSGVLAKLPRSGNWMLRVNRVLATLMIVAAGYYGSLWYKKVFAAPSKSSDVA